MTHFSVKLFETLLYHLPEEVSERSALNDSFVNSPRTLGSNSSCAEKASTETEETTERKFQIYQVSSSLTMENMKNRG